MKADKEKLMNIAIVYDTRTGTTARAAQEMGKVLEDLDHQCQVQYIGQAKPADVSKADLICVGSWVQGLFIIGQHPTEGTMEFIERLENIAGKQTIVFCTYKLASGSTLRQMANALEGKGAKILGQFKFRGPEPNNKFSSFARSLT